MLRKIYHQCASHWVACRADFLFLTLIPIINWVNVRNKKSARQATQCDAHDNYIFSQTQNIHTSHSSLCDHSQINKCKKNSKLNMLEQNDLVFNVLLHMGVKDIKKLCTVNKIFAKHCESLYFWQSFSEHHAHIMVDNVMIQLEKKTVECGQVLFHFGELYNKLLQYNAHMLPNTNSDGYHRFDPSKVSYDNIYVTSLWIKKQNDLITIDVDLYYNQDNADLFFTMDVHAFYLFLF